FPAAPVCGTIGEHQSNRRYPARMDLVLFEIGRQPVTALGATAAAAVLVIILLCVLVFAAVRAGQVRREELAAAGEKSRELESHLARMIQVQDEMTGRIKMMDESLTSRTSALARMVDDRLDMQGQ